MAQQPPPPSQQPNLSDAGVTPHRSVGTNGFAIAALVLGLVWLGGLGAVLALVFGIMALRQIGHTGQDGRGMAIAGVVLGAIGLLVPIALITTIYLMGSEVQEFEFQETCASLDC